MTVSLACRYLASLWPAPSAFAAVAADGSRTAGDAALATCAVALLERSSPGAAVAREGDLVVVRAAGGGALAGEVPGAALPGLLELDLRRAAA